ncbi:hypothetical protein PSACC_00561 [Paramicrosporidium saccamoebae]|uniref:Formamidopyrimidine-DNA glycosylase catalytic domain-containing protein n=1 Tax=Paramicrosporidium saccamoebae TaxID=1246581 RepID=A0A2H9TPE7_9FUNG|nr:hypothetical protein PSACC_00561 [Paramicrosporidium saccamoebae]
MPELPSVEHSRCLLERTVLSHRIANILAVEDNIVFSEKPSELENKLKSRQIIGARRYGKYLWLVLSEGVSLLMHFGMTGFVQVQGVERLYYRTSSDKEILQDVTQHTTAWPPRFWKLQLETSDGCKVVFGDSRRLGHVKILEQDPMSVPPISKLGFDPIICMPDFSEEIFKRVTGRSVPLKTLLLDQSFAAGVGNWMADDVLLHARLHPETRTNELSPEEVGQLLDSIKYISVTAVGFDADGSKYPPNWVFHCRWPSNRRMNANPTIDGHKVAFITVGGRTTVYVPDLQKKSPSLGRRQKEKRHKNKE